MAENPTREYIKDSFKNFYTVLKSKFIKSADIVKSCTSTSDTLPLAASQGKILNDKITNLEKNNVLYSSDAGHLLKEGNSVSLSDKISNQKHGVILVLALRNSKGDSANSNFQTYYVPKNLVGKSYDMSGIDAYGRIFVKHVYISDSEIHTRTSKDTGNVGYCDCNMYSGTASGTTGNWVSANYALKYVIGI